MIKFRQKSRTYNFKSRSILHPAKLYYTHQILSFCLYWVHVIILYYSSCQLLNQEPILLECFTCCSRKNWRIWKRFGNWYLEYNIPGHMVSLWDCCFFVGSMESFKTMVYWMDLLSAAAYIFFWTNDLDYLTWKILDLEILQILPRPRYCIVVMIHDSWFVYKIYDLV